MAKASWYATTEARLYEYKTYEKAMYHLQQRNELDKVSEKLKLKGEMDDILAQLSSDQNELVNLVYFTPNTSPAQVQRLLGQSEATFYRKKREVVTFIAKFLGYL